MPPAHQLNNDPLDVPEPVAFRSDAEDSVARRLHTPPPPAAPPPGNDGSLSDLERALVGSIKDYHAGLTAALDRNTAAIEGMSKALSRFALGGLIGAFVLVVFLVAVLAATRGVDPRVAAEAAHTVIQSIPTGQ